MPSVTPEETPTVILPEDPGNRVIVSLPGHWVVTAVQDKGRSSYVVLEKKPE